MKHTAAERWLEDNRRFLMESIEDVGHALDRFAAGEAPAAHRAAHRLDAARPPAIEALARAFGLSSFERDVLLLCAGVELSEPFAARCAAAASGPEARQARPEDGAAARPTAPSAANPTFALALAALPGAHWSAITPPAPLRRHRLVEVLPGDGPTRSPLRIDERVLHYLVGIPYLDDRLRGTVSRVAPADALPPSHQDIALRAARSWSSADGGRTILHLCGSDAAACAAIAAAAAASMGLDLHALRAADLPGSAAERDALLRLWERESLLGAGALMITYDDAESGRAALSAAERLSGPSLLAGPETSRIPADAVARFDVDQPTPDEQLDLWKRRLGPLASSLNGHIDTVVAHFSMSATAIRAAGARALSSAASGQAPEPSLWEACRAQVRTSLDDLAQRIEPSAGWDDLVLGATQRSALREIAMHVRQRAKVYGAWGFGRRVSRGLGVSALFAGVSGTGKTMAAEVLARHLSLDLYRIDLSQVVSKYIGETEKNLRRVFDAAEQGGAILLFDEADALFGKRSDVKDSHDRYANIEVSYLLSRMESYRGLSILTTNQKGALDPAFLRRIRFFVAFPFPDAAERTEIWRRAFPADTPTDGLDPSRLARLNVPGGNIRNIALCAAFLAADEGSPVRMAHLRAAAVRECAKIERPVSDAEIGGWA